MFFNAHTYYSIKRNGGIADSARIVGALLADSAIAGVISWTDLHDRDIIEAFSSLLSEDDAPLARGLRDHYELDLKSHDTYEGGIGYAFSRQTHQLRELVTQACGLDSPEQVRGIAHNFIESGVDINLLRYDSSIREASLKALRVADIEHIARYMAAYFKTDTAETKAKLTAYFDLITTYDLEDLDGWVALWADIISLLLKKEADGHAIREGLQLALKLTARDYQRVIAV